MAKKFKSTKVNYYQLRVNTKGLDTLEITEIKKKFKKAVSFKDLIVPTVPQGDGNVSPMKTEEINTRYIAGALIYTQETNIPPKFNQTTQTLEAIDIAGFSGLGFDAVYFYDSENMILAIESKVPGPTLESFNTLLLSNFSLNAFEIIVVTSSNDYEKFINSLGVKTLEIKMLNLDAKPEKKTTIKSVQEITDLIDRIDGNYIDMKISVGNERNKFLDFNHIKRIADFALKTIGTKNEVTKFKLDIVDLDSGKVDPIDLITNRIFDTIKIEKVTTISKFSIKEKINQVEKYYLRRRPLLDTAYRL